MQAPPSGQRCAGIEAAKWGEVFEFGVFARAGSVVVIDFQAETCAVRAFGILSFLWVVSLEEGHPVFHGDERRPCGMCAEFVEGAGDRVEFEFSMEKEGPRLTSIKPLSAGSIK